MLQERRICDRVFLALLAGVVCWGVWWFPGGDWIISQDVPIHYAKIAGAIDNASFFSFEHTWLVPLNGGRMLFHGYPYLMPKITQLLALVLPLMRAQNLTIFLAWLCCPLTAWYYLRRRGEPLAGVLACCFLFLEPGFWLAGGFQQAAVAGIYTNCAASGMLVLAVFRVERFTERPDGARFVKLAICSVLLLTAHTNSFFVFAASLPWFAWRLKQWRNRLVLLVGLPLMTISLAGPIWIGLLVRRRQGYWLDIYKLLPAGSSNFTIDHIPRVFIENLGPMFLVTTVPGLLYCLGVRPRAFRGFEVIFWTGTITILGNWLAPAALFSRTPLGSIVQPTRLIAEWRSVLLAGLALAIVDGTRRWITRREYRVLTIGLLAMFLILLFGVSLKVDMQRVQRLTPERERFFERLWGSLRGGEGRVLHQTMFHRSPHFEGRTHMDAAMPLFNGREVITFDSTSFARTFIGGLDFEKLFRDYFMGASQFHCMGKAVFPR